MPTYTFTIMHGTMSIQANGPEEDLLALNPDLAVLLKDAWHPLVFYEKKVHQLFPLFTLEPIRIFVFNLINRSWKPSRMWLARLCIMLALGALYHSFDQAYEFYGWGRSFYVTSRSLGDHLCGIQTLILACFYQSRIPDSQLTHSLLCMIQSALMPIRNMGSSRDSDSKAKENQYLLAFWAFQTFAS
jgi:hypothetical protein